MKINFKEKKEYFSQISIVNVLLKQKYYFAPINEFDNEHYYCILKCPALSDEVNQKKTFWQKLSDSLTNNKIPERKLSLSFYDCEGLVIDYPMVFTKQDIINILKDIPDNYVGEEII